MKKQFKMGLAALGVLILSTGAIANDGDEGHNEGGREGNKGMKTYSEMIETQYTNLEIDAKKYDLEFELKDLDTFLLLEVEVESNFFGTKPTNVQIEEAIVPVLDEINEDIQTDLNKPLRVFVEYNDTNVLNKRY